jgi:hypothetical protein
MLQALERVFEKALSYKNTDGTGSGVGKSH